MLIPTPNTTAAEKEPWLQVQGSRHFLDWLAEAGISLAFSTYQTGKLFFIGRKVDHSLAVFERTFNHCMGAVGRARRADVVAQFQVSNLEVPASWRSGRAVSSGLRHGGGRRRQCGSRMDAARV